jgi:hypothetical protein
MANEANNEQWWRENGQQAELQFTAGFVAYDVALRFVDEERFWESVAGDDSPWDAAGSLLPIEGRARQFVAVLIRLGRRAGSESIETTDGPWRRRRRQARFAILQMSSMVVWGPGDPLLRNARRPSWTQKGKTLDLLGMMLAGQCVVDGCDGRVPASKLRVGSRPICCEGHASNRDLVEKTVRSRVKDLLSEALDVVADIDEDLLSPEPARRKRKGSSATRGGA